MTLKTPKRRVATYLVPTCLCLVSVCHEELKKANATVGRVAFIHTVYCCLRTTAFTGIRNKTAPIPFTI